MLILFGKASLIREAGFCYFSTAAGGDLGVYSAGGHSLAQIRIPADLYCLCLSSCPNYHCQQVLRFTLALNHLMFLLPYKLPK